MPQNLLEALMPHVLEQIDLIERHTDWHLQFEVSVDGTPQGLVRVDPFFENKKTGERFVPPEPEPPPF